MTTDNQVQWKTADVIREGFRIYHIPGFKLTKELRKYCHYRNWWIEHNQEKDIVVIKDRYYN